MSFGFSPTDIINLVQFSTRVYVAFKDANDNSEAQVAGLKREFTNFHRCLLELSDLMQEYGKPLPFPYLDFKETLERCDKTIEPYAHNLVDRRMSMKKALYIIKYIGKETEIENLRNTITGHHQALQMCISFLQLRLHLEATRQTQRLLDLAPFRAINFGGHHYTTNATASSSHAAPNALPPPSDADQLYRDWQVFSRWLKHEDERLSLENDGDRVGRRLSLGATPPAAQSNEHTAAVLYHLRKELEDAITIEENRAKRVAVEKRTHLTPPSDAVREEMKDLRRIPPRTYTVSTDRTDEFYRFGSLGEPLSESTATLRPGPASPQAASPAGSPQIEHPHFDAVEWGCVSPPPLSPSERDRRTLSVSTDHSDARSIGSRLSISTLDISTAATTPEGVAQVLRPKASAASLVSLALGCGALQWTKLCKKVQVERVLSGRAESRECDLHWRYREDAGISIRSVYRLGKEVKVWTTQQFGASGPSIPLTTSFGDGTACIDFPRGSHGRLDRGCTSIMYTVCGTESSTKLQTLLYTNNGQDEAELLYDRRVVQISSDLNRPECRGKNVRLWRKSNNVLYLLFYTSALREEKAHWVEEPHYLFQWLDRSTVRKESDKLQLIVSKEPSKWTRDKVHASSSSDFPELQRSNTRASVASSTASVKSGKSIGIFGRRPRAGRGLNRFGYGSLEIEFRSQADRRDFLNVWQKYVRELT